MRGDGGGAEATDGEEVAHGDVREDAESGGVGAGVPGGAADLRDGDGSDGGVEVRARRRFHSWRVSFDL